MSSVMLFTMLLCFALTVSVAVSIGLSAIVGIQIANANMLISVKEMFNSLNKFPLAAIPFFILAGNLMETGGISRRLVEFAKSIVGGIQGGLPTQSSEDSIRFFVSNNSFDNFWSDWLDISGVSKFWIRHNCGRI
jgi:TRAP-type mannitol/chloroaromatic compound transport system permease large subunit